MNDSTRFSQKTFSRRDLLKSGAVAAAGAAVMPAATHAKSTGVRDDNAATKNMHLSLAAYSIRGPLQEGEIDLFDFIDWCGELGLAGTELTSYYFRENIDETYLHELKRHAWEKGLTVSGTAVGNNFCLPPGQERQQQIDHVKTWIDHAVGFYAPHVRIFAGSVPDGVDKETGIGWVIDSIREVLTHAEDRGVRLGLENHGGITSRAADHLAICEAIGDHPWFGINLDTGNYRTNVYEELRMAAPWAVNVQVKVHAFENDGTEVEADFERVRDILVDAGYKGWVTLEYEDDRPRAEIPTYIQRMQDLF